MKFELETLQRECSLEEIQKEFLRVSDLLQDKIITRKEFDTIAKISSRRIMSRFKCNWNEILKKFGLESRYSGIQVSAKMKNQLARTYTNEAVINEIKRVASYLKTTTLSQKEFNQNSELSSSVIYGRFGSWEKGLKLANLKPKRSNFSEIEYFENLLTVWTHYGRQPKQREMNEPPSFISGKAYEAKFGKWTNGLIAFINYANKDVKNIDKNPINNLVIEDVKIKKRDNPVYNSRTVSVGLRYAVLSRDRFKCVKCGKSPSSNIECRLHVDHILPFSKCGKTIIDNLQTTCEECNIGKGNKYNE